jgi:hypothetical protein
MVECKVGRANQTTYADFDLGIFEQTPITSEPTIKIDTREMFDFQMLPS